MVPSFREYIRRYIHRQMPCSPPSPGEHHFVATYLLPRLYEINGLVPDYVNPDGTKSIIGDVVYYRNEKHHFSIEVKLGTISLTKREFNDWVASEDSSLWPNVFIGIGNKGVALCPWSTLRSSYVSAVAAKRPDWKLQPILERYGPSKKVDELAEHLPPENWFPLDTHLSTEASENHFLSALRAHVEA